MQFWFGPVSRTASGLSEAALTTQNISNATKVVEKTANINLKKL
jgi:hypothetical protein